MAKKEVTVVINGEEYVSKAAESAEQGMQGFFGKAKGWTKGFADIKAGWDLVSGAVGKVWGGIQDAIAAYDDQTKAGRVLETSSRLLGVSLEYLNGIVDVGRTRFGLSKTVASEYAIEVAKLEKASGQTGTAQELLASFLDLGAAKGLTASESMQAVRQSLLGIDEGTDKLFGKNPSGLWDDFAAVIGRSAGKFSDMDKAAALAYAALRDGDKVVGAYASYLGTAAGKQAVLNERLTEAEASFGAALQPARLLVLELGSSLLPVLGPLARMLGGTLALSVTAVGKVFNKLYGLTGALAVGLGLLTNSKDMTRWGGEAVAAAEKFGRSLDSLSEAAVGAIKGVDNAQKQSAAELAVVNDKKKQLMADLVTESKARAGEDAKATKQAEAEKEKAWRDTMKAMKDTFAMLESLSVTTQEIAKTLGPAYKKTLPTEHVDGFNYAMKGAKDAADQAFAAIKAGGEPSVGTIDRLRSNARLAGVSLEQMARTVVDGASAFGLLDDAQARALQSAISLGVAVAKLATGTGGAQDIAAAIGSAASLISQMIGSDGARKKLIAENTQEMARLRREVGNLSLDVSGETFGKVQDALASVIDTIKGGRGAKNTTDVLNALTARGVGMNDLKKVADQLGIKIYSDSGALSVDGLKQLFEAMGLVELGQFGSDFAGQLESVTKGFDINGASDADQIAALGGLGGRFSEALRGVVDVNDLAGTRERLAKLFKKMQEQGLSAGELGGLTGSQFLDLITNIIGRIDDLAKAADGGVSTDTGTITAGGISLPPSVVEGTQTATASSVASLLTDNNAFQARIANATEQAVTHLASIDDKMSTLIDATLSAPSRIDAALENMARQAALNGGTLPVLR